MREIKFRAWDNRYDQYHEETHRLMIRIDGKVYNSEYGDLQCDRFIIEQCTGLKDKNGVEIYEGDIIHAFGAPLEIKWIVDGWFADCEQTGICEAGQEWDDNCEVIGNIHESPELLE